MRFPFATNYIGLFGGLGKKGIMPIIKQPVVVEHKYVVEEQPCKSDKCRPKPPPPPPEEWPCQSDKCRSCRNECNGNDKCHNDCVSVDKCRWATFFELLLCFCSKTKLFLSIFILKKIFFSFKNFFFSSFVYILCFGLFFTNLSFSYAFFSILETIAMEMTSVLWNVANRLSLNQIVVAVATKTVPEINHLLYGDVNQANPSFTCKFRKPSSWVISYQIQICWNCIWTQILRLMQMESLDAFVWMTRLVLI